MHKLRWIVSLVFILSLFFILPTHKLADNTRLNVSVDFPVTHLIKYGSEVEVQLKVLNNGEDFSGDLMYQSNYLQGSGMNVVPFDIASGEEKSIRIVMATEKLTDNVKYELPNAIFFYESGVEKGKQVKAKFNLQTQPTIYSIDDRFLYNISSDPDRLLTIKNELQKKVGQIEIIDIVKNKIPVTKGGFSAANTILIDDLAIADFSNEQITSLEEWVRHGGTLIVSGQNASNYGAFDSYLPLVLGESTKIKLAPDLEVDSKQADLKTGAFAYAVNENNEVIVGEMKFGSGRILQTPFLIGDSPQSESNQFSEWFIQTFDFLQHQYYGDENEPIQYIEEINNMFEQFKITVGGVLFSILIYTMIIGPILYIVLRKLDKREYAWGLIPIIAIITAVMIFFIGGKDRLIKPQIQQLALFKVNNDQSATGIFTNSLLTNRSGDYLFTMDNETKGYPRGNDMFTAGSSNQNYVKGKEIIFNDSRFWSVNTIAGESHIPQLGAFQVDLKVEDGMLQGTVEHTFPFEIFDVGIWTSDQYITIGHIKPNSKVTVSEKLNQAMLKPAYSDRSSYDFSLYNIQDAQTEILEAARFGAFQLVQNEESPTINGWTDEPLVGLSFSGNANQRTINYFTQPFEVKVNLEGKFTIKNFEMNQSIVQQNAGYVERVLDDDVEMYFEDENTIYTLQLPSYLSAEKINLTELTIKNEDMTYAFEIWNESKQKYVEITNDWKDTDVKQYIANNQLKIRPAPGQRDIYARLPIVELKGEAK